MADILDTTPAFDAFAAKAFLQSPFLREQMWESSYEAAYPEVFAAFYAAEPAGGGRSALVRDLSALRELIQRAAPVTARLINDLEPRVAEVLGVEGAGSPRHVLLVGAMSASVVVGRLHADVALFHCLEWFTSEEGAAVQVAHEDAHAFHHIKLGQSPAEDAAWTAFYEGLAARASRAVVPGRPEADYFWYGHEGFEDWLPWCEENAAHLEEHFAGAIDEPGTTEEFFGSGLVDGHWRVGFYLADRLVGRLDRPLPELLAMSPEEGRLAIRQALAPAQPGA